MGDWLYLKWAGLISVLLACTLRGLLCRGIGMWSQEGEHAFNEWQKEHGLCASFIHLANVHWVPA